jgi:hypothetical protein
MAFVGFSQIFRHNQGVRKGMKAVGTTTFEHFGGFSSKSAERTAVT